MSPTHTHTHTRLHPPFNLLCSTEVHLHACLCKLQFLLNTTPNCRHMLEWSRCPSEAKWVTTVQRRLFWNQQPWCQTPTLSPPPPPPLPPWSQTRAESISGAPAPDGRASNGAGEVSGEEEWGAERGNERKVRDWGKKKKKEQSSARGRMESAWVRSDH